MNISVKELMAISCAAALLFCNCLKAFAETSLPHGTVAGLPEKLSVLDSEGNSVSERGEYFFEVENMQPHESYSKDIQITNLREDKAYHIYFYAEPLGRQGDIDLENDCTAVFTMGGEEIFTGKVTGESADGGADLSQQPIDLGSYLPGQSRSLNCTVTWNGESADEYIDFGHRVVSADGVEVLREPSGKTHIEGEVTFRWTFYAVVDESYDPPDTGLLSAENAPLVVLSACVFLIVLILAVLVLRKKKRRKCRG